MRARWTVAVLLVALAQSIAAKKDEAPVLAYLFTLRRARHPLPHAWTTYFQGCAPGSYRIHIHVDPNFNATSASEAGPAAKYFKQENVLPKDQLMTVRRFGHTLVQARMKLLRHATSSESEAKAPLWYSFFSESCAPISTCEATHAYLSDPARFNISFIDNKRPMPPQQVRAGIRRHAPLHTLTSFLRTLADCKRRRMDQGVRIDVPTLRGRWFELQGYPLLTGLGDVMAAAREGVSCQREQVRRYALALGLVEARQHDPGRVLLVDASAAFGA